MENVLSFILSIVLVITPPSHFKCDGKRLTATIRNNLNGDFAIVDNLEKVDEGAFVVLNWDPLELMLPVSFQKGSISFTDKKWLWSYQDREKGLHEDKPRFAHLLPNGEVVEHECILYEIEDV